MNRLADAEPSLGVLGPVMWGLASACLAGAAFIGLSFGESGLAVAGFVAIAAILGLGTAPFWMVRIAVRRHARRQRHLRDDARSLRSHLEQAFVDKRIDPEEFQASDAWLDDVRRGRSPAAVAATLAHYLRGVAFSLALAGMIIGLAAAGAWLQVWEWQEYGEQEGLGPWLDAAATVGTIGVAAGLGGAVLFGVGAGGVRADARRRVREDTDRMEALRAHLLAARRV